ncbi:substrate-binding domain-containing protein [Planctomicrobium sp. SH664]|uniref:XylR family transcriptional regulator n=1 Tax=Planctomicrobium sp. SH664 TaxID=3448125 RepID=UPI003F5B0D21
MSWSGEGILARIGNQALGETIRGLNRPVVDLKGIVPDLGIPYVGSDHRAVGEVAIDHLWEKGLRHFSFCALPPSTANYREARFKWFARRVAKRKGEVHPGPVINEAMLESWEARQTQLASWLQALPKPIGIMTCQDDSGLQVIEACRRAAISVPEQVAVIGVDDDELQCNICCPPLTSIDLNAEQIGYEAAALLNRMMNGEETLSGSTLIPPRGVVPRQSTDLLAVDDPNVVRALRVIQEQACRGLRVGDLLKVVPLSRATLEKRFRETIGRTPKAEITRVQIERATKHLVDTDDSLEAIARSVGLRDARYLCDVFHRKLGCTPGAYRKQRQGLDRVLDSREANAVAGRLNESVALP